VRGIGSKRSLAEPLVPAPIKAHAQTASSGTRGRLTLVLIGLGLLGVASLLALPLEQIVPGPVPFSPGVLRALALVQPCLLVIAAAVLGSVLAPQVGLDARALRLIVEARSPIPVLKDQARRAVVAALPVGVLIALFGLSLQAFGASLDGAAVGRLQAFAPPVLVRLLYGGLSEEIISRWGLMTLIVWTMWWLSGRPAQPTPAAYWTGLIIAALVFALGHLPILYALAGSPPVWVVGVALTANLLAGMVFGYLYWRAGLETAMMAHALSHVVGLLLAAVLP
jgi:membrane protease YdiL (CAAX protease family)